MGDSFLLLLLPNLLLVLQVARSRKKHLMVGGDVNVSSMHRDKILLRCRIVPKRITLPNGQSFVARYERVSQKNLPSNVTIKKRNNRTETTKKTQDANWEQDVR